MRLWCIPFFFFFLISAWSCAVAYSYWAFGLLSEWYVLHGDFVLAWLKFLWCFNICNLHYTRELLVITWDQINQGIDRKDVRIVCHFNIPKSMEAFYQESGRAGRDQLPSRSLLYYGVDDRKRMVGLLDTLLLFFLLDLFSHCNLCQEFILRKSVSKKSQSSSSQEESSKMSLIAFNLVTSNLCVLFL